MSPIPLAQNILDSFETLKEDMDTIVQKIKDCDSEICDILHDVELTTFNACEGYLLAKELQRLRKLRREYKEQEEQLDMLRGFVNKYKWMVNDLRLNIKTVQGKREQQLHRIYSPKIRTDLKIVKMQRLQETAK